ncbi:hypothetical protein N9K37_03730 [Pseudomonadales bacterium]|nr:hypothetical protein [Pseudomonadales bacterium]
MLPILADITTLFARIVHLSLYHLWCSRSKLHNVANLYREDGTHDGTHDGTQDAEDSMGLMLLILFGAIG